MNWKNVDKRHKKIILISSIKHFFDYIIIFFIIFLIDLAPLIADGGKGGFGPEIETQSTRQLNSIYSQIKYCIVITIAIILILCLIVWILYFLFYNFYLHIGIKKTSLNMRM